MTFKDLKKRITSGSNQQQTQSFGKLQNKPFWIWNIEEHKQEDVSTKVECCFNHIIWANNNKSSFLIIVATHFELLSWYKAE
jgi:hypothetical protein